MDMYKDDAYPNAIFWMLTKIYATICTLHINLLIINNTMKKKTCKGIEDQ